MEYTVHCDYETSKRAGAGGHFQVIDLKDDNDNDCTNLIDQGKHYSSLDELRADIAAATGANAADIILTEV